MRLHHLAASFVASTLAWATGPAMAQTSSPGEQPPPIPPEEQPEVLTRGPVHEAFAQPVELAPSAHLVAPFAPPAYVEEEPPASGPDGDEFVWIPGYWAWDVDSAGYVWVSACWRVAPPGMCWVPGYWHEAANGWEWIPGFWSRDDVQSIEYLPAAPPLPNVEPPGVAPSSDVIWVPPIYYWVDNGYALRPGYWMTAHEGWVWVPARYVSTPYGYAFAEGHWDYPLERRGVLFAPVRFPRALSVDVGFRFSPSVVVDLRLMTGDLFAFPLYSHYCFGDYYDDHFLRVGIYPWCDADRLHRWYDPIFAYDRWNHRHDVRRWADGIHQAYERRREDRTLRPPATYRELRAGLERWSPDERRAREIARPLERFATDGAGWMTFHRIDPAAREEIGRRASQVDRFRRDRRRWETSRPAEPERPGAGAPERTPRGRPERRAQPEHVTVTNPPIRARPHDGRAPAARPPSPPDGERDRRARPERRGRGRRGAGA